MKYYAAPSVPPLRVNPLHALVPKTVGIVCSPSSLVQENKVFLLESACLDKRVGGGGVDNGKIYFIKPLEPN